VIAAAGPGQAHADGGSGVEGAFDGDASAMGLDDGLGDGQSQPDAVGVVVAGIGAAPVALEDAIEGFDANSFDVYVGTSAGAFLLSVLYPVSRYLIPPSIGESMAGTVTLSIKPADLKANTGQIFKFGNRPAILVRTPAGELRAFSAVCTHLNCTVQYRPDLGHIWCACHNGHFDPNTGMNIAGPPPRPLEQYGVSARADKIVVSRSAPA